MTQVDSRWRLAARRRIVAVLLSAVIAAAAAATVAAPPSASYLGHAYLVVNNWRCVGGGKVISVNGAVDDVWSGGDAGDNIIWPKVRVGDWNTFNGWAWCSAGSRRAPYMIYIIDWQFHPSGNNQTFWY
jgi:hypothetical protein